MYFFDCNCCFGLPAIPMMRYAHTVQELEEEMAFCGIDRALVYHANMRFFSPLVGNRRVVSATKDNPSLLPTWALLPAQTGEGLKPDALLAEMADSGVRALWAFPNEHRYALDALTYGDLMEVLQEKRIPLLAKVDLVSLGRLLVDFPDLVVVAMNQGPHSLERHLRSLIERYPNLYVDTSYYMIDGLIEEFCTLYGPERLLFGTAFPDNCSGGALLRLAQADIAEEHRKAIAGRNLERVLQEARL